MAAGRPCGLLVATWPADQPDASDRISGPPERTARIRVMPRLRVGVIFGGRSGEHEVSLASAASVIAALERRGHQVVPIGIGRDGRWVVGGDPMRALAEQARGALPSGDETGAVKKALADRAEGVLSTESNALVRSEPAGSVPSELPPRLHLVLIALHRSYREDRTIHGPPR